MGAQVTLCLSIKWSHNIVSLRNIVFLSIVFVHHALIIDFSPFYGLCGDLSYRVVGDGVLGQNAKRFLQLQPNLFYTQQEETDDCRGRDPCFGEGKQEGQAQKYGKNKK